MVILIYLKAVYSHIIWHIIKLNLIFFFNFEMIIMMLTKNVWKAIIALYYHIWKMYM